MKSWLLLSAFLLTVAAPQTPPPAVVPMGSRVIDWTTLAPTVTRTGQRRDLFDAPTATLDKLHGHVTTLNPGENTGPLHRHPQEELVLIQQGTVEVNIDGRRQTVGAGSVIYFAVNENENMTNVGQTPATYVVLQWFTPRTPKA
ncbi:MAG: cupin domain-containing protein [Vicinamibacterales bacterium]